MTDDAARSNLLSFIGGKPQQLVRGGAVPEGSQSNRALPDSTASLWSAVAAHVVELRQAEVIDDPGFSAIARALLAARQSPGDVAGARAMANWLDAWIEARTPVSVSGAATLGLAREEWLATTARLAWREGTLLGLALALDVSEATLILAETHAVTTMPAYVGGRPAQPTTLAHYLGAVIGPLRSARERLVEAFARVNRSPLGAGMLAGDVLAADREDLAQRLGFAGPVPNTMDALASVEDVVGVLEAMSALVAPLARFVQEVVIWIRTDPASFVLDEGWSTSPEPAHPALVMAERLDTLTLELTSFDSDLDALKRQLRRSGYGPLGMLHDTVIAAAPRLAAQCRAVSTEAAALLSTGLLVNRAWLGNRAGRGYTTAADLATFLMTEERIPPTAARQIALLVLARLKEASLEVSGITPDSIDSAALITIGREIKVEMETLGRFLAPRRYIERRQVTGSPAPERTRAWLEGERTRLAEDRRWLMDTTARIDAAMDTLVATIDEAAGESPDD